MFVGGRSEINESELMNPSRMHSLLEEAQLYEQQLLIEKDKLRQRLAVICNILNKPL